MTAYDRELLSISSPVAAAIEDNDSYCIKGFVSVDTEDRYGHVVDAEAFSADSFMAGSAPVYVNHKPWKDGSGNEVSVGRPSILTPAKLVKGVNADEYGVYDLRSKEIIDTFPKQKVPNLRAGDRGLFARIEISQYTVWEMIKRGELGAFSWKGLARSHYGVGESGELKKIIDHVDLYEITLANIPVNTSSTFVVQKSVDELPLNIYSVKLDKKVYGGKDAAITFLKAHDLSHEVIREEGFAFYSLQKKSECFDLKQLATVEMSKGVSLIVGPLVEPSNANNFLDSDEVEQLVALWQPADVITKEVLEEKSQMSATATPVAETVAVAPVVPAGEVEKTEVAGPDLAVQMTKAISEAFTPIFTGLTESLGKMASGMEAMSLKMESLKPVEKTVEVPKVEEVAKVEESVEQKSVTETFNTIGGLLKDVVGSLTGFKQRIEAIEAKTETVSKSIPAVPERRETVETVTKSVVEDKNSCFDTLLPISIRRG